MKIVLGSTNKSKVNSILLSLNELNVENSSIYMIDAKSNVSSKPINNETLQGAINRNNYLLEHCLENNIEFDCLISIEGGYKQILDKYFIVTYAVLTNEENAMFIGKSVGLEISEKMFSWVKEGKSLNKVIDSIEGNKLNKKENGISGYISNRFYKRDIFDSSAVTSAFVSMINYENNFKKLNRKI